MSQYHVIFYPVSRKEPMTITRNDLRAISDMSAKIGEAEAMFEDPTLQKRFTENVFLLLQVRRISFQELCGKMGYEENRKGQFSRLLRFARKPDLQFVAGVAERLDVSLGMLLLVDLHAKVNELIRVEEANLESCA